MYLFIEKGLRGRISYICKRYSKVNNKYMKNYDPTSASSCKQFMGNEWEKRLRNDGYLAYGGFKWLKNVVNFDVNSISEKSPIGYILEVGLEYPEEIAS